MPLKKLFGVFFNVSKTLQRELIRPHAWSPTPKHNLIARHQFESCKTIMDTPPYKAPKPYVNYARRFNLSHRYYERGEQLQWQPVGPVPMDHGEVRLLTSLLQ